MKKRLLFILILSFFVASSFAQKKDKVFNAEGENAIYKKEWSLGMRFHTNALSLFFEHVWIKDIKRRKLIQVNLFGYIDLREKKIKTILPTQSGKKNIRKFYYGKQNNFYSLQLMYGNRRVLANKSEVSGVKLSLTYLGGVTLGLLKPYYLDIEKISGNSFYTESIRYEKDTEGDFLNRNKIIEPSGFDKGFNKMTFAPGLTAKLGLNFDFARKNTIVTSLEVGSQIDVFYRKINIYANDTNKPYILNLYLSFQIGKRI